MFCGQPFVFKLNNFTTHEPFDSGSGRVYDCGWLTQESLDCCWKKRLLCAHKKLEKDNILIIFSRTTMICRSVLTRTMKLPYHEDDMMYRDVKAERTTVTPQWQLPLRHRFKEKKPFRYTNIWYSTMAAHIHILFNTLINIWRRLISPTKQIVASVSATISWTIQFISVGILGR